MHPAPSVIVFTTFSGLGFGLLFWLGLGFRAVTGWTAFAFFTIAYVMAVGGLIASTFHLGHPERAIKAFKQWRSSWLSREGICAVIALIVMALYGAGLVFFTQKWILLGLIGALFSLLTVFTTSMIYTQLKTIPRWNQEVLTPANFLSLSLAGGALMSGQVWTAIVLLLIAGTVQLATWIIGDNRLSESGTNLASATQLGNIGEVRAFEPPHTGTNYLLREFVHVVGRKHAQKTADDFDCADGRPAGDPAAVAVQPFLRADCGAGPYRWRAGGPLAVLCAGGTCCGALLRQAVNRPPHKMQRHASRGWALR